jgi:DegV family protein with EDD domain
MRIQYIDGDRLRRALLAGCEYVQLQRTELNRINVFPVPDGDTGTNLALTASSIAERLRTTRARSVGAVAHEAAEAGILGARGNCGMILSHFLLGFSESAGTSERMDVPQFARALQDAVEHVYRALEKPVEGTIVTVMRETAQQALSARTGDFADLLEDLLQEAQESLARTPDLLPALRAAGVVDAGAKGFVHILEGVCAYVEGTPFVTLEGTPDFAGGAPAARVEFSASSEQYRFCTEALVRGADLPTAADIRTVLRERGDSLIVIRSANLLKLHIHTDVPDAIFDYLRTIGELATHKAEDMKAQHQAVEAAAAGQLGLARRPMSIVSDTACDLPDEIILAHGIHLVPLWVMFENQVMRDRFDIDADEFVQRLRGGERGTTSQPAPADFIEGFRRAAQDGETVLAVLLASALSGTYSSAEAAAKRIDQARMVLFDSRAASLLQGLLVLKAAELAELGWTPERIVTELSRVRDQSGVFFTVDVFDNLLASGRIGRGKVLIADLLDIKPILEVDNTGRVVPLAKVRGRARVLGRMLSILEKRVPRGAKQLRFGLVHVGCEDVLDEIAHELRRIYGERDIVRAAVSPVLATHLGPGAWGLAYQLEDEPL